MSNIEEYWTRTQAAANFNMSEATLKKYEKVAEDKGYGLGEPFMVKKTSLWHMSEWMRIQRERLRPFYEEAVMLGFVVPFSDHEESCKEAHEEGYRIGYDHGYEQGVAAEGRQIPTAPEPLSEDAEVQSLGFTSGGFLPLNQVGL